MEETNYYRISIKGKADVQSINEGSPIAITDSFSNEESTLLIIQTDQSGLIGLLRYLHTRGGVFESIIRQQKDNIEVKND